MAAEVDFKVKKLCLYQGDKTSTALVWEETCNQKSKQGIKKQKIKL